MRTHANRVDEMLRHYHESRHHFRMFVGYLIITLGFVGVTVAMVMAPAPSYTAFRLVIIVPIGICFVALLMTRRHWRAYRFHSQN